MESGSVAVLYARIHHMCEAEVLKIVFFETSDCRYVYKRMEACSMKSVDYCGRIVQIRVIYNDTVNIVHVLFCYSSLPGAWWGPAAHYEINY